MILKMIVSIFLLVSCVDQEKHRYLIIDEIFSSGKITPKKLEIIYKIFGRPEEKLTMKGSELLHHSIDKTNDLKYSIKVQDGKVVYFALKPADEMREILGVDAVRKILPHLKLIKSKDHLVPIRDMIVTIFRYDTPDNRFEIEANMTGRVDTLIWKVPNYDIASSKTVHKQKNLK